ncbi:sensor histidine kinase [Dactylosporangium fulvum]|uniref:sensor histidine kinase n=1 Tax=Dactylosporangium fulvum TaxID=53359 RepID=UPI0031D1EAAB
MIGSSVRRVSGRVADAAGRAPAAVVDGGLAVATFVALVAVPGSEAAPTAGTLVLTALISGALALRRRAPLTGYLIGTAALVAEALWIAPGQLSPYANLIGLYSLGQYGSRRRSLWGPFIALAGVLGYFAGTDTPQTVPAGVMFTWLLAWAAGYGVARRREQQAAARERLRREAVADERTSIARELHDVVGHAVTVMLVRAGAARVVLERDPEQARQMLTGLEQTGREALDQLDLLLGALRSTAGAQPGTDDLARLAERMTEAGMTVTVRLEPPDQELPRSLDGSVYRIVQEALTNALRHGRAGAADVLVRTDGTAVEVDVRDDGRGPVPGYQPGRGLLGITERVAELAGTVEHAGNGTGFHVRAVLPLP